MEHQRHDEKQEFRGWGMGCCAPSLFKEDELAGFQVQRSCKLYTFFPSVLAKWLNKSYWRGGIGIMHWMYLHFGTCSTGAGAETALMTEMVSPLLRTESNY